MSEMRKQPNKSFVLLFFSLYVFRFSSFLLGVFLSTLCFAGLGNLCPLGCLQLPDCNLVMLHVLFCNCKARKIPHLELQSDYNRN